MALRVLVSATQAASTIDFTPAGGGEAMFT
jgi:hypothetical protein